MSLQQPHPVTPAAPPAVFAAGDGSPAWQPAPLGDPAQWPATSAPASGRRESLISLRSVSRVYRTDHVAVEALRGVDLDVGQGEFLAIVGPSGSGKSTLMHILGCLDRPTGGDYRLAGQSIAALDDNGLADLRGRFIGFIFQSYNLLPRTSALENVAAPLLYQGVGRRERLERARVELERLGLGDRMHHEPTQLSGGQQQRVAIARALVTRPALILADEPTGNLDTHSGAEVMELLVALNREGRTIVLITHDVDVAAMAGRQVHVRDGMFM
jgi:putative ABC transport system ATP-binding protein